MVSPPPHASVHGAHSVSRSVPSIYSASWTDVAGRGKPTDYAPEGYADRLCGRFPSGIYHRPVPVGLPATAAVITAKGKQGTMKDRYRKLKFLKHFDLIPQKNPARHIEEGDFTICERLCFYYFDNDEKVVCRGCYKRFESWVEYRIHLNTPSCHTTEANYKLNTYNAVYKKYKFRKAKTKKKINDRLSAAQLMDPETLNTRKTRKRCYTNTRAIGNGLSKSSSDSCSSISETVETKTIKKETYENGISSDEGVEYVGESVEMKPKTIDVKTVQVQDIPESTKTNIPNLPHDNQLQPTIKMEWNADDISQVSSDDQSSSSIHCLSKYQYKENKALKYPYVCVICDERFVSKCLLTMHQVQHIKSDRSSYNVFMAALTRTTS